MKTERLIVTGLTCGGCVNSLTRALKAVSGVDEVNVVLATGETTVSFDEHSSSVAQLKSAVENAGFGIDGNAA